LDEDLRYYKDKGRAAAPCSDQEVVDFLKQLDEDLRDYKDRGNVQLRPNQLGKPIEGDLGVDVDETEVEFLGLDEQLPTEEFEGLDDAEEDLEGEILRFARSFNHKGRLPLRRSGDDHPPQGAPRAGGRYPGSAPPEHDRNGQPAARGERDRRGSRRRRLGDERRPQE